MTTIGSLFSGCLGLDLAIREVIPDAETVFVADIDPGAAKVLAHRAPHAPNLGDVAAVDWSPWRGRVEIVTAGFPCQDVSAAGKRAGLAHGTRTGLWHETARAIAELRPSLVLLENVRGLLTARGDEPTADHLAAEATAAAAERLTEWIDRRHALAVRQGRTDDARALAARRVRVMGCRRRALDRARRAERRLVRAIGTVLGSLADLGYDAAWCGLRAADVGAAHGRWRVFILAWPSAADPIGGGCAGWTRLARRGQVGGTTAQGAGALLPTPLLPTPAVNDMGAGKTPDQWDAWTDRMKAEHGNGNGHGPSLAIEAMRLLPTPTVMDHAGSGGNPHTTGTHGTTLTDATVRQPDQWGKYAVAIHRWETVLGRPAPAPTETGPKGNSRLSCALDEWLMGLPAGWITDVPNITHNETLRLCGNGVVPRQGAVAFRHLLNVRDAILDARQEVPA